MRLVVDRKLTPAEVAEAFCEMNDEEQAQVFIEIARIAEAWEAPGARSMQWFSVGRHLRDCSCSTWEARCMITEIAGGIEP